MKNIRIGKLATSSILIVMLLITQNFSLIAQTNTITQNNWKKIDLERFSFYVPPELKSLEAKGIDSEVWIYSSDNLEIIIDLGIYSRDSSDFKKEPSYQEKKIKIDGKKGIIFFFYNKHDKKNRPYYAAVHFPQIGKKGVKLSFFAACASPQEQQIARKIFTSIDFNRYSDKVKK